MMDYSQGGEQHYIVNYFGDFKGRLMDCGAADGKVLSNSFHLLNNGWSGAMIEPSAYLLPALINNMNGLNVEILNCAIGTEPGWKTFYESNGDFLSTTSENQVQVWKDVPFKKTTIWQVHHSELLNRFGDTFDFINVDVEGSSFQLFKELLPVFQKCRLWCVEHDSKQDEIKQMAAEKGMSMIYENGENILIAK